MSGPVPSTTAKPAAAPAPSIASKPSTTSTAPLKQPAPTAVPSTSVAPAKTASSMPAKPAAAAGGAGSAPSSSAAGSAAAPPRLTDAEMAKRKEELDAEYEEARGLFLEAAERDPDGRRENPGVIAMGRVRDQRKELLGADHEDTLQARMALGRMLMQINMHEKAVQWLRNCLRDCERAHGRYRPVTWRAMMALIDALKASGMIDQAQDMAHQALAVATKTFGPGKPETAAAAHAASELDAKARELRK